MAGQSSPEKTAVKASAGLSPIISGALCEQENNGWGSATVVTRAACIGQTPVGNGFGPVAFHAIMHCPGRQAVARSPFPAAVSLRHII
jgi:hypothetical protein